jgi:hypothetical protein
VVKIKSKKIVLLRKKKLFFGGKTTYLFKVPHPEQKSDPTLALGK